MTAAMTSPFLDAGDRGGHAGCAPLLSHATARNRQAGTSLISQAATGRQADREPAHRTLWTLRPQPQLLHRSSNKAGTRAGCEWRVGCVLQSASQARLY